MSKIMRLLYAEARAAREAAGPANQARAEVQRPAPWTRMTDIELRKAVCARAAGALKDAQAEVAAAAICAVQRPCAPEEHVRWWRNQMTR